MSIIDEILGRFVSSPDRLTELSEEEEKEEA